MTSWLRVRSAYLIQGLRVRLSNPFVLAFLIVLPSFGSENLYKSLLFMYVTIRLPQRAHRTNVQIHSLAFLLVHLSYSNTVDQEPSSACRLIHNNCKSHAIDSRDVN
ncbi:hypothetical protein JB92DRAFT_1359890 [Gautieria morchelliformis]|nr:hypothetical protein JB92DRAFT_1359890 [Gautieria morchelliformis]